jgi:hypothetical protein
MLIDIPISPRFLIAIAFLVALLLLCIALTEVFCPGLLPKQCNDVLSRFLDVSLFWSHDKTQHVADVWSGSSIYVVDFLSERLMEMEKYRLAHIHGQMGKETWQSSLTVLKTAPFGRRVTAQYIAFGQVCPLKCE